MHSQTERGGSYFNVFGTDVGYCSFYDSAISGIRSTWPMSSVAKCTLSLSDLSLPPHQGERSLSPFVDVQYSLGA